MQLNNMYYESGTDSADLPFQLFDSSTIKALTPDRIVK